MDYRCWRPRNDEILVVADGPHRRILGRWLCLIMDRDYASTRP